MLGSFRRLVPELYSSPGLLSEAVSFALIQVDESLPENQSPKAKK